MTEGIEHLLCPYLLSVYLLSYEVCVQIITLKKIGLIVFLLNFEIFIYFWIQFLLY